jgi:hypothetical protein
MLDVLGGKPQLVDSPPDDDDWYANVFYIQSKKCVLLTHAGTLFSTVSVNVGVGLLRPIESFASSQIVRALRSEGLPEDALGRIDHTDVRLARTSDRSVLGSMNDMVHMVRHITRSEGGLGVGAAESFNRFLHETPNGARGFATPLELVGRRVAGE